MADSLFTGLCNISFSLFFSLFLSFSLPFSRFLSLSPTLPSALAPTPTPAGRYFFPLRHHSPTATHLLISLSLSLFLFLCLSPSLPPSPVIHMSVLLTV